MYKLTLLLFIALNSISLNVVEDKIDCSDTDPLRLLRMKVASLLANPDIHLDEDVKVLIKFKLNEKQRINVTRVLPENNKIINLVENRLNNKKFKIDTEQEVFTVSVILKKTKN